MHTVYLPLFCLFVFFHTPASSLAVRVFHQHPKWPSTIATTSLPLLRRRRSPADRLTFIARERVKFNRKYQSNIGSDKTKRDGTALPLSNAFADAEYYGEIQVGTPAKTFQVILDSGSADLWLATSPCNGCLTTTPMYDPTASSSSSVSTTPFQIEYGSGDATGDLTTDVVSIAGFGMKGQTFAAATNSTDVVSGDISGLLGLGWQGLATSKAVPLLQGLSESGLLPENMISFAFTRFVHDDAALTEIEPGGFATVGGTNSSLYDGDISWNSLINPTSPTYWLITMQAVTIQGSSASLSGTTCVIDSGTSLIAGPAPDVLSIYTSIPGSQETTVSGQAGYYAFPCATEVTASITFGGVEYSISSDDFNAGPSEFSSSYCIGAFFVFASATAEASWIIGDSFLKNVYTSFRFSPDPAVGFAQLSIAASNLGGSSGGQSVIPLDSNPSSSASSSAPTSTSGSDKSSSSPTGTSGATSYSSPSGNGEFSIKNMAMGLGIGSALGLVLVWLA